MRPRRLAIALAAVVFALAAQSHAAPVRIDRERLAAPGGLDLAEEWRYKPGDENGSADPALDDSGWAVVTPAFRDPGALEPAWPGIGWFRLRLDVAPELVGVPLALRLSHLGASELYVDGARIATYGTVAATPEGERGQNPLKTPIPITFDRAGEHVVAVRYSSAVGTNGAARWVPGFRIPLGFEASVDTAEAAIAQHGLRMRFSTLFPISFFGILCAFGVLHFWLFIFHRTQRANLYYAIFALSFAANTLLNYLIGTAPIGTSAFLALVLLTRLALAGVFLAFVAFLYSAFAMPTPKYFRWLAAFWAVVVLLVPFVPAPRFSAWLISLAIGLSVAASMYTIWWAFMRRLNGSRIIFAAAHLYAFALACQLVAGFVPALAEPLGLAAFAGFVGMPLVISVYLAREFARTSQDLEAKLVEVETLSARTIEHERREAEVAVQREQARARIALLEAENERRARELEEARQLQLSMLPADVPRLPGLEVAAYLKPATEVGGDYYDFHLAPDGTLTVAVGDATGHGLKAGTLVTATKGLFNAFASEPDIPGFLSRSSAAIKRLNLRHLYMALTIVKIKDRRVRVSAAGMPPMLVHRAATGTVDEIVIRGMPLGGVAFPYQEIEIELEPGDTLLLMSDGFPERFNEHGEMLDYAKARDVLAEIAGQPPSTIIEHFVATGEAWANGHPQNDDVTFVVLKAGV